METEKENTNPESRDLKAAKTPSVHHSEHEGDYASPDKYLAIEQPGVSFTGERDFTTSDSLEYADENGSDLFDPEGNNSLNADAFTQDDYILRDNIDLDEDQSQSISSENDIDTNGGDGL